MDYQSQASELKPIGAVKVWNQFSNFILEELSGIKVQKMWSFKAPLSALDKWKPLCVFSESPSSGVFELKCGAAAERRSRTGEHSWRRCYHGDGLDSFYSSSVLPSPSSSLSITSWLPVLFLQEAKPSPVSFLTPSAVLYSLRSPPHARPLCLFSSVPPFIT